MSVIDSRLILFCLEWEGFVKSVEVEGREWEREGGEGGEFDCLGCGWVE